MNIDKLLNRISALPNCTILPADGFPEIHESHALPEDVMRFYELCGGLTLFENEPYSLRILSPHEVKKTTPIYWGTEVIQAAQDSIEVRVSSGWYAIVDLQDSNYLSIDLNWSRLGRCYKTFWDSYAVIGETPVVASSFGDLLERLLDNRGMYWYFLEEDFVSLGDAFDDIE